jgi:hypothetical protein
LAINYPGPFEIRVNYVTDEDVKIRNHQLRLSFQCGLTGNPGDPFTAWKPIDKLGSSVTDLKVHVDALVVAMKPSFFSACSIVNAELWEYAPNSFDAVYRSVYAIAVVGTSGSGTVPGNQAVTSYRTRNGGIFKTDLRGTVNVIGAKQAFPLGSSPQKTMSDYILLNTTPFWGRDNSYPLAGLAFFPGSNEHAFKVLYR